MKIKEVMTHTGLTKKAIHYYIQQGLISPDKYDNGYYEFSNDDLDALLSIISLKSLGFSLSDIDGILHHPELSAYYLIRQEKMIKYDIAAAQYKAALLKKVLTGIGKLPDCEKLFSVLSRELDPGVQDNVISNRMPPIDDTDAEMLAQYFWGSYMENVEMTEYMQFLWSKLKETIIADQTPEILLLRDTLYSFDRDSAQTAFGSGHDGIRKIAGLTSDDITEYCKTMIINAERNLNDHVWVKQWNNSYMSYIHPCTLFFDGAAARYMRELSSRFASYQDNINECCERFRIYLQSEKGSALLALLNRRLGQNIDISGHHSGDLASLAYKQNVR